MALPLADESRQFKLLVQSVSDYAIYMLDPVGHIRSWNAGGERIKGYRADEVIGTHFSRFYTPEDAARGEPARSLATARAEGRFSAEGWRQRKDGSRFWASVVVEAIWQRGELIGFAKVTRDVTERYEAQKILQQAQRALMQSQKIEAVGRLTLGLAHDFNNLLTVIVNSLDLIGMRPDADARTHALIEVAQGAADRGTLLTRQLLAFARGQDLAPERHAVNEVVGRSLELFRRACSGTIRFEVEMDDGLPDIWVDAGQLEAALLNLVVNGRDAMPQGGRIVLSTSAKRQLVPDDPQGSHKTYVSISVQDEGHGMPPEVAERVFEPFFTTKEVGKGSGLGLSQVFGFASQSGGFVDLDTAPGRGTRVSLLLPAFEDIEDIEHE
nr:PAS domain-containing sensor histidine kinase [Xanthomonas sp.]